MLPLPLVNRALTYRTGMGQAETARVSTNATQNIIKDNSIKPSCAVSDPKNSLRPSQRTTPLKPSCAGSDPKNSLRFYPKFRPPLLSVKILNSLITMDLYPSPCL